MASIRPFARRLRDDSRGATLVEYSILIGLLSASVIGIIINIGPPLVDPWSTLANIEPGDIEPAAGPANPGSTAPTDPGISPGPSPTVDPGTGPGTTPTGDSGGGPIASPSSSPGSGPTGDTGTQLADAGSDGGSAGASSSSDESGGAAGGGGQAAGGGASGAGGGVDGASTTIGSGEIQVAMAGLGTSAGDRAAFGELLAPIRGGNAGKETKASMSGEDNGGAGGGAGVASSEEGGWRATMLWVVLAGALVVGIILHLIFKETSSHKSRDRLNRRMTGVEAEEA